MKNFPQLRTLWLLAFALAIRQVGAADLAIAPPSDALPKIHRTVPFHFPVRMLREGVKHGEARILLHVNREGKLGDSLVIGYTHPSFGEEAVETVKQWSFEPARSGGEPVSVIVDLSVTFEISGVVAVERPATPGITKESLQAGDKVYQPHSLKYLDGIPVLDRIVAPVYPPEWIAKGLSEKIVVDFYIDESGQIRMPTIASGKEPLLCASALAAVQQWHFEPPTYQGKPVLVHAQHIFDFSPPAKAP